MKGQTTETPAFSELIFFILASSLFFLNFLSSFLNSYRFLLPPDALSTSVSLHAEPSVSSLILSTQLATLSPLNQDKLAQLAKHAKHTSHQTSLYYSRFFRLWISLTEQLALLQPLCRLVPFLTLLSHLFYFFYCRFPFSIETSHPPDSRTFLHPPFCLCLVLAFLSSLVSSFLPSFTHPGALHFLLLRFLSCFVPASPFLFQSTYLFITTPTTHENHVALNYATRHETTTSNIVCSVAIPVFICLFILFPSARQLFTPFAFCHNCFHVSSVTFRLLSYQSPNRLTLITPYQEEVISTPRHLTHLTSHQPWQT